MAASVITSGRKGNLWNVNDATNNTKNNGKNVAAEPATANVEAGDEADGPRPPTATSRLVSILPGFSVDARADSNNDKVVPNNGKGRDQRTAAAVTVVVGSADSATLSNQPSGNGTSATSSKDGVGSGSKTSERLGSGDESNTSAEGRTLVPTAIITPRGPLYPAVAGVASTCRACNQPRVSRRVTCKGCRESFHWSCMGIYEHKYDRPPPGWQCKDCKVTKPTPTVTGEVTSADGSPLTAPKSGDVIANVDPVRPCSKVPGKDTGAAAPHPLQTPASSMVSVVSPKQTGVGSSNGGDRSKHVCPVCRTVIGRKRIIDCLVCNAPFHTLCVNVRGAARPRKWVCHQCSSTPMGKHGDESGGGGAKTDTGACGTAKGEADATATATSATAEVAGARALPITVATMVRAHVAWIPHVATICRLKLCWWTSCGNLLRVVAGSS